MISADSAYMTVKDVFNTVQGEGSFAGTPATFIRFSGCSVKNCFVGKCDTDWKDGRAVSISTLIDRIKDVKPYNHFVVTGGEPLDQKYLLMFLVELITTFRGCTIQVETSASKSLTDHYVRALTTFYNHCPSYIYRFEEQVPLFFTCSPKIHRKEFMEDLFTALTFFNMFRTGELKIVFDPELMTLDSFAKLLDDPRIDKTCYRLGIKRYIMLEESFFNTLLSLDRVGAFLARMFDYASLKDFRVSPRLHNHFKIK